jgi:hypothetical protein
MRHGGNASFTRRGALVAVGLVVASIAASMFLAVYGDALTTPRSWGTDSWSRSALGHHAFVALLEAEGRTVLVSRARTADKAAGGAPTALLEPAVGPWDPRAEGRLEAIAGKAKRLLVVLPKRTGPPDLRHRGWVESTGLVDEDAGARILKTLGIEGEVVRPAASIGAWKGSLPSPALDHPQLVRSDVLDPLLACKEGILVGELEEKDGPHVVVVADPDLLATHGLGRGRNAEIALAALKRLGGGSTLIVDETLHGHELEPSLVQELLRFPLVLATLQALAALALLSWAALVRFGRPIAAPPLLRAGKDFLVQNMADLLRAGGHAREAARAYLKATREEVLARIPPPGGAEAPEAWLLRLEAARGRAGTLASLEKQVAAIGSGRRGAEVEALRAAQRIQRWREELTHGAAAGDPREARGRPG